MGTRVLYEILGEINGEQKPVCILYSNSSHENYNPEEAFEAIVRRSAGPTEAVEHMLACRYPEASGNHREGDRMFWIVTTPYGDYEHILRVDLESDQKEITRLEREENPTLRV